MLNFKSHYLRQAPRPGDIDQVTAEGWTKNQKSLKNKLIDCLVSPLATETAGRFLPKDGEKTKQIFEADTEKILKNNSQFLTDIFVSWYNKEEAKIAKQSVKIVSPKNIAWLFLEDDISKDKFGEYTMNPDTVGIDWENIPYEKIEIFDFPEFIGKPIFQLGKYLTKNYSDRYHIPGIEYWKFIYKNEDKVHKELKDGNYYYFFGSILCGWGVPYSDWDGGQWDRSASWLKDGWRSCNRVLLLKK